MQSTPVTYKTKESFICWWPFSALILQRTLLNIIQLVVSHIYDTNYTIICNDQVVNLAPSKHDQRGQWIDPDHGWDLAYDSFTPCDWTRKPGAIGGLGPGDGYTAYAMWGRFIYLYPKILDNPKGRSLAPYRDQLLVGQSIDVYCLLPVALLHELLHTSIANRKSSFRRRHYLIH